MLRARRMILTCFVAGLILAFTVMPSVAYFLLGATVDPASAYPGDPVKINYTVGDPSVPYSSAGPYEVEIYYCNAPDPRACFDCGRTFEYPAPGDISPWHGPVTYSWFDRFSDFQCKGTVQGLIGVASHHGAKMGDTFTMNWTIPTDLPSGKYNIHILVGYSSECLNWTHYNVPIDILWKPNNPAIHIDKTGPSQAYEGDTIRYEYKVTNAGNCDLQNVTVDDDVVGPPTCIDGDTDRDGWLDLTETWLYEAYYTIPMGCSSPLVNTATATGYDSQGTMVTDQARWSVEILCRPNPQIDIVKSGPALAYEGDTITYDYAVTTGTGNMPLQNVTVNDDIAGPANYVSGDTNNNYWLDLNETWCFEKQYTIPAGCPNPLVNTATATGYDAQNTKVTAQDTWSVKVLCKPYPKIHIDKTGPSQAYEGETITYEYKVTNPGTVELENVTVDDDKAGSAAYVSGDTDSDNKLDPGEEWLFKADYMVPITGNCCNCGYHDGNNCQCDCCDHANAGCECDCWGHNNGCECDSCNHADANCGCDCCDHGDDCSKCCECYPYTLVNTATATGYYGQIKVTDQDSWSVRIVCRPFHPTSQITNTDCCDLTTMVFNCKKSKISSTSPGGLLYWVRWNTGSYSGMVTINVKEPSNDFVLWSQKPVQVVVNGMTVYTGKNTTWTGFVGANSHIVMRVHYKSSLIGYSCALVDPTYTFSADVNGMPTSDLLLTSCVNK